MRERMASIGKRVDNALLVSWKVAYWPGHLVVVAAGTMELFHAYL